MNFRTQRLMQAPAIALIAAMVAACASIGRPEGGERDKIPPRFLRSDPMPGELNVSKTRLSLWFDENLQLDDASNKVIVSPAQTMQPIVTANAKRVKVELRDSLIPNTTYTIDFGDAIQDLNEANPLDGFALAFSTGSEIDSLSISGMVLEARNLEPAQGMLVGVHFDDMVDSTLSSTPLRRVTRTNQYGRFTLRNLPAGSYRIFAIDDVNRDNRWSPSENIAFFDSAIAPTSEPTTVCDTLTRDDGTDTIVIRPATRFLPNDVLLTWFNEDRKSRYLVKNERPERRKLTLEFGAQGDSLPSFAVVEGPYAAVPFDSLAFVESTLGMDTLSVWLTDTAFAALDTIRLATRYQFTDSLEKLSWRTDTLSFLMRRVKEKKKEQPKAEEADSVAQTEPLIEFLNFRFSGSSTLDPDAMLTFASETPVDRLDENAFHLLRKVDTLWVDDPQKITLRRRDSLIAREFIAEPRLEPGAQYRLTVDSAAIFDIFGIWNKPITADFSVKPTEEYSTLFFKIDNLRADLTAVVELLRNDEPVKRAPTVDGIATIPYINPGQYYARLFIDSNGDGLWTPGNIADSIQPEEVYYYPKKLNLKKNWDVEQSWDIYATPVDLQKPEEIKKNKPKKSKWEIEEEKERQKQKGGQNADDEDDDDPFSSDPFMRNNCGNSISTNRRNSMGGGNIPRY